MIGHFRFHVGLHSFGLFGIGDAFQFFANLEQQRTFHSQDGISTRVKIYNFLPILTECVRRWEKPPGASDFIQNYFEPMKHKIDDVFDDGATMHRVLSGLDWAQYRGELLSLDPAREEARVRKHLEDVEKLFGFELEGEIVLFGAFGTMDGYARFERGSHRVYLGVDESDTRTEYLDILEVHELTHVARESRSEVWLGWGLDPKMTHDEFVEAQPVVEHVFGEGFSCAISEMLVPSDQPWRYSYQDEASYKKIRLNAAAVDTTVHSEISAGKEGDWGALYNATNYKPRLPLFTHYLWGWEWARHLIRDRAGGDPSKLINLCSKDLVADALSFRLPQK